MKKQRTVLSTFILFLFTIPFLHSCLDDSEENNPPLFAIGTLKVIEGKDYYFALDEGSKLYPGDTTEIHNYTIIDGQRAFIYFNALAEAKQGYEYNAKINNIQNILTKDIYSMPPEKADSIGDDRINIIEPIWITGNYVNIEYQIYHSNNPNKPHLLNLIINEASTGENDKPSYLTLEFRHNAYNDETNVLGTGVASFKLDKITELLKDKQGLNIRVKSLYDGEKHLTVNLK